MTTSTDTGRESVGSRVAYSTARGVALVSAVFVVVVCVLLFSSHSRTRAADPLNAPALKTLTEELRKHPGDEALRGQVRELDLLARRAFFAGQRFATAGAWLLLGGTALFVISAGCMVGLRPRMPRPGPFAGAEDPGRSLARSRWAVAVAGGALLGLASTIALFSGSRLESDPVEPASGSPGGEPPAAVPATAMEQLDAGRQWPNFRGPEGIGVAFHANAPTNWDGEAGVNIAWRSEVPRAGYNSPVVWGGRIFLSGGDEEIREVYCYDADSGELLWRRPVAGAPGSAATPPEVTEDTGYAAPTVATDGARVCAIFATGDLVCLDLDGRPLWARALGVPDNHYGHSSSLVIHGGLLFVQYDHNVSARVLAVDVTTGETVWEQPRGDISWASPICVETEERSELVLVSSSSVESYDVATGTVLWREECLSGEVGPSAAYSEGVVFVAQEYATAAAIDIASASAGDTSGILWRWDEALPDAASPVAAGGYLVLATSIGVVTCLDAATAEVHWSKEFDEGFYSSPIVAGDRVYATDMGGVTHIFTLGPEYEARGRGALGERVVSTPAFMDGRIFVRTDRHLTCIEDGRTLAGN